MQLITYGGTTFMVPQRLDVLLDVANKVPLPTPPKIRVRSDLSSLPTVESDMLYLRSFSFFCR